MHGMNIKLYDIDFQSSCSFKHYSQATPLHKNVFQAY